MRDFNVDILKDNNQTKNKQKLLSFLDKFQLKSQFSEKTTRVGSQSYHIWANVLRNECKYGVIENILVKFSQTDLYCIQITKHTSNV
jgi:hypothetical protein